ncbi:hypothetical protein EP073_09730 [Geovibrio thiophilus]|uniref:Uncharacterized protein n=1 Tax=Geovibrio thiophilus TaxID=139438 RepID=A0A410K010_9BACT|nr:hypothetical protein [Geovibrio thiophilus]QAR33671.1 hypothetical protein EP073_09730 [Geovibrio thiophilus]
MSEKKRLTEELAAASRAGRNTAPDEGFADRAYRKALESMAEEAEISMVKTPAFAVLVPVLCVLLAVLFITENYMVQEKTLYLMELLVTGVSGVVI